MNEKIEIEVIACCPECGHSFNDWILLDMECPFFFGDLNGNSNKVGGEIDVE